MPAFPRLLIRRPRVRSAIERTRLLAMADSAPTVVIVGAPGTGKTTLASQVADRHGGRVGWCRFAPGWDQVTDLPAVVAAALDVEPPEADLDLLTVADQLLDLLDPTPTTLVIEDLHESVPAEAERVLAEVAAHLASEHRLVITTRRRPTELIGLSDGADVAVVAEDALRFDDDEAAALLARAGMNAGDAVALGRAYDGWAAALAAADVGDRDAVDDVIAAALDAAEHDAPPGLVDALVVLPYLTAPLAEELGVGSGDALAVLAEVSSLVAETDGHYLLNEAARRARAGGLDPGDVARIAAGAIRPLADTGDVVAAIGLAVDTGHAEQAAELLAANASAIGADRATRWLYRLPADFRRGLPPVLSGGRATVNISLALATAREALAGAAGPAAEREALLGLGSLELAEGDLAAAASSLEAADRLGADDPGFQASVRELLGQARWLAGDAVGARAALEGVDTGWAHWLAGVIALLEGDLEAGGTGADAAIAAAGDDLTDAVGLSLGAAIDLASGDGDPTAAAARAYAAALDVGGRDLLAAGPVQGWVLLRSGEFEAATQVADQVDRVIGRQDETARLLVALLRRSIARRDGSDRDRAERRVRDLRSRGFAPLEALSDLLDGEAPAVVPAGLDVRFCGDGSISVDGAKVSRDAWKSKKALEVALVLADAGPAGMRREPVIESVWPGREPEKGRTLLRTALSEIRRVLEPQRVAGQESRFVRVDGDRVQLLADTDLARAAAARAQGDHATAFRLLVAGPAPDLPDADWVDELRHRAGQQLLELATRVAEGDDVALAVAAHEALIEAEPWQRSHFDGLAALHRRAGDELAAADVERRWFADD